MLLGDSMGEMFAYYAACDCAFIGGSLLPLGGQNLIEACALGKPVLVGQHTFNFAQATEEAIAAGGALRVRDAGADAGNRRARLLADAWRARHDGRSAPPPSQARTAARPLRTVELLQTINSLTFCYHVSSVRRAGEVACQWFNQSKPAGSGEPVAMLAQQRSADATCGSPALPDAAVPVLHDDRRTPCDAGFFGALHAARIHQASCGSTAAT